MPTFPTFDEIRQLLQRGADPSLFVSERLDAYNNAMAATLFLTTGLLVAKEIGASGFAARSDDMFAEDDRSRQFALLYIVMAQEALDICIEHNCLADAPEYLAMIKARRLTMQLMRAQMQHDQMRQKFPITEFYISPGAPVSTHIEESKDAGPVAVVDLYYNQNRNNAYAFVLIARNGGQSTSCIPIFTAENTQQVRQSLTEFLSLRDYPGKRQRSLEAVINLAKGCFQPVSEELQREGVKKVVIIPHRFLHLIPWHVCLPHRGDRRERDTIELITFVPNAQIYDYGIRRPPADDVKNRRPTAAGFFDVLGLPSGWACGMVFEKYLGHLVPEIFVRAKKADLLERLRTRTMVVFDGHATADFSDISRSGLQVIDGKITPKDFLTIVYPSRTEIVILNACETGVNVNIDDMTDEYVGLDGALVAVGVRSVVSTLWPVDDMAAFLMGYRILRGLYDGEGYLADLVHRATRWLRDGEWVGERERILKICDFAAFEKGLRPELKSRARKAGHVFRQKLTHLDAGAFSHPEHWAAWRCVGHGGHVTRSYGGGAIPRRSSPPV